MASKNAGRGIVAVVGPIEPNMEHLQKLRAALPAVAIIAVDGGYQHLLDAGIPCNLAVGDFDSLGYVPTDCEVKELPTHKDQTDTEVALDFCASIKSKQVYVYGTLGARVDHTMAFLQLLGKYAAQGLFVIAVGRDQGVLALNGKRRGSVGFPEGVTGTFSLLALTDMADGVTMTGVEYPLENATITNTFPLGISNEFTGSAAKISLKRGTALLFLPSALV